MEKDKWRHDQVARYTQYVLCGIRAEYEKMSAIFINTTGDPASSEDQSIAWQFATDMSPWGGVLPGHVHPHLLGNIDRPQGGLVLG